MLIRAVRLFYLIMITFLMVPLILSASISDFGTAIFDFPVIIIIIIISIFKEDNVFSITASLAYGPPVNTDIDYYRTFFGLVYFCKCCEVSCAIFC